MALTQKIPSTNRFNRAINLNALQREITSYANKINNASSIKLKSRYIRKFCSLYNNRPMGIKLLRFLLEEINADYPNFTYNSNTRELTFVNLKVENNKKEG